MAPSKSTRRPESRARSNTVQDPRRGREQIAFTTHSGRDGEQTAHSGVSHASVHVDPTSSKAIQVDRNIKDPDKFKGEQGTFYPWMSSMTLKLSTATFRIEADGLRYVQGSSLGPYGDWQHHVFQPWDGASLAQTHSQMWTF
jgi:hypothetical protein